MKTLLRYLVVFGVVASASLLSAATFEGKVRMKMTSGKSKPMEMTYSMKNGLVRMDLGGDSGETMGMVMNYAKREMTILMPEQKMYMVRPIPPFDGSDDASGKPNDVSLEKTSETETILGYECTKYIAKSKDSVADVWVTEELGAFMGMAAGGNPMSGKSASRSGWEKALMGKDFFPLRVVSKSGKADEQFRMEAVAVDRQSLPDALFTPPAGYQKFDLGGMMRGLGGMTPKED